MTRRVVAVLLSVLMWASVCNAAQIWVMLPIDSKGAPAIDMKEIPHFSRLYLGGQKGWGTFLLSGTTKQIEAIASNGKVMPISKTEWIEQPMTKAYADKISATLGKEGPTTTKATPRENIEEWFKPWIPGFSVSREQLSDPETQEEGAK